MLQTTLALVKLDLRGTSQPYDLRTKKSNFDIDRTFSFENVSSHHVEKRLNADYTLPVKSN